MKKTHISKARVKQEMDPEYRFDYGKAKPNRFAEKLKLNVGWTVEKFVEEEKKEKPKASSSKGKSAPAKKAKAAAKKPVAKAKPVKKKKK